MSRIRRSHARRGRDCAPALRPRSCASHRAPLARDSSTELARLEFGRAADGFDRYARLAPDGDAVTVADFEVRRLTELLKTLGVGS
jgi:hypothetical protein